MNKDKDGVMEIDLIKLFQVFLKKAWIIVLSSVLVAVIALAVTVYWITPTYQSSVLLYVNYGLSFAGFSSVVSSGDISMSKSLVSTYLVILKTRLTLEEISTVANVPYTYEQLSGMITASAVDNTEIFRVTVTGTDPYETTVIANSVAKVLPSKVEDIISGASARVVDYAVVPQAQSAPSYTKNTAIGFLIGFFLACGVLAVKEIFQDTITSEDYLIENFDSEIPLLATIPEEGSKNRYGKYYKNYYNSYNRYGYYESKNKDDSKDNKEAKTEQTLPSMVLGPKLGFASTEAYNLLRTNLLFTIPDKGRARIVGISSPCPAEGKSCCSINLSYSLASAGSKVLLIDCDLRKPTIAKRLNLKQKPGLSDAIINPDVLYINEGVLHKNLNVITSGSVPPNPSELVGSASMKALIEKLSSSYDYIIIDLPPVNTVADTLLVLQITDGVLEVIRHNFTRRSEVNEAVRQLSLAKANVIGFVYNAFKSESGNYGHYHGKYYSKYGYSKYYYSTDDKTGKKDESKA